MDLIFGAFFVYFLSLRSDLCMNIFNRRVKRRIEKHAPLSDGVTVALSKICWHCRLKLKISEASFKLRLEAAASERRGDA